MTFMTTEQLATLLHLNPNTLAVWRTKGLGPKWRKLGRRILYCEQQALEWLEGQTRQSTREGNARARTNAQIQQRVREQGPL